MLQEFFSGIGYIDSHLLAAKTNATYRANKVGDGISSMFKSSSKSNEEAKDKTSETKKPSIVDAIHNVAHLFLSEEKLKELGIMPHSDETKTKSSEHVEFPTIPDEPGMKMPLQRGVSYGPNPFLGEPQKLVAEAEGTKTEEGSVPTPAQLEQAFSTAGVK